jgi:large subunit ribosomal protein L3
MKALIGKKIGMTAIFTDDGKSVGCTLIEAGPCYITSIRTKDNDGYSSVQLGFVEAAERRMTKPVLGKLKKNKLPIVKYQREFRDFDDSENLKIGEVLNAGIFTEGDSVKVSGITKGKGFQGVMKRHGFAGAQRTHGQSDRERAPGSIGASSYPSRVFKGQRMAGRKGNERVSIRNLKVVKVFPESNLLLIKGAVPGSISGLVEIYKS